MGAADIYAVDTDHQRLEVARQFGATVTLLKDEDPVRIIMEMTSGHGVDVSIEALGEQRTFENALCVLAPGGRLSSVGMYSGHLSMPLDGFHAGLGDQTIVTTLCPGGKDRMRRLMRLVQAGRIDLRPLLTHTFEFAEIAKAYQVFASRENGVLKVAIRLPQTTSDEDGFDASDANSTGSNTSPVIGTGEDKTAQLEIEVAGTIPDAEADRLCMEAKEALRLLGKCGKYHFCFGLNPKVPSELMITVRIGTARQVITVERDKWREAEVITGALVDQLNV